MIRFSANVSTLFGELAFLDRFAAARQAGFSGIEFWFPYEHAIGTVRQRLDDNGLTLVGINAPPGEEGQWGLAALPGREDDFRRSVELALDYATGLDAAALHVLAGLVGGVERHLAAATYHANLDWAARRAAEAGVQLLIEPLNSRDRPGYFLAASDQAAAVIQRAGLGSIKMMFDCYHVQIAEGDLIHRLRRHLPFIGHIQIAGVPWRQEPDRGEVNYRDVLLEIDRLGWNGWIGAEYFPADGTLAGLGWIDAYRDRSADLAGRHAPAFGD